MSGAYAKSVKFHLPGAKMTFDRFHIIKLMNERLDDLPSADGAGVTGRTSSLHQRLALAIAAPKPKIGSEILLLKPTYIGLAGAGEEKIASSVAEIRGM